MEFDIHVLVSLAWQLTPVWPYVLALQGDDEANKQVRWVNKQDHRQRSLGQIFIKGDNVISISCMPPIQRPDVAGCCGDWDRGVQLVSPFSCFSCHVRNLKLKQGVLPALILGAFLPCFITFFVLGAKLFLETFQPP